MAKQKAKKSPPKAAEGTPAKSAPWSTEVVEVASLKPHPKNYRRHPDEQLEHIQASLEQHDVYRNIVIARDGTILAGHGVVEAARRMGRATLPVKRLDIDPKSPEALKVLVADNELGKFADDDDRLLATLLKILVEKDSTKLLGTGYDDSRLAALLAVTQPVPTPEGEWAGMPDYETEDKNSVYRTTVHFASEDAATAFFVLIGQSRRSSTWWPKSDGHVGSTTSKEFVSEKTDEDD